MPLLVWASNHLPEWDFEMQSRAERSQTWTNYRTNLNRIWCQARLPFNSQDSQDTWAMFEAPPIQYITCLFWLHMVRQDGPTITEISRWLLLQTAVLVDLLESMCLSYAQFTAIAAARNLYLSRKEPLEAPCYKSWPISRMLTSSHTCRAVHLSMFQVILIWVRCRTREWSARCVWIRWLTHPPKVCAQ